MPEDTSRFIKKVPDLIPEDVREFLRHIPPPDERTEPLFPIIFNMTEEEAMKEFDFSVFEKRRLERVEEMLAENIKYFLNDENYKPIA